MDTHKFLGHVLQELRAFVNHSKRPSDFAGRFYVLADAMPSDLEPQLREAFERFHYDVACYEPREEYRRGERSFIDEHQLRQSAKSFLSLLETAEGDQPDAGN